MGVNARRKVVDNFTIGKFITAYEDVYARVARKDKDVVEPIFIRVDEQRQAAS